MHTVPPKGVRICQEIVYTRSSGGLAPLRQTTGGSGVHDLPADWHECCGTVGALIQKPLRPGQGPWVSVVFVVFGRFPLVFGLVSYPPGPILESVFLWRVSVDRNLPVCTRC